MQATSKRPAARFAHVRRWRRNAAQTRRSYRLYLQGCIEWQKKIRLKKRGLTFKKAVQLDPTYARAWAGKAYAHRTISTAIAASIRDHRAVTKLGQDENMADAQSIVREQSGVRWDCDGAAGNGTSGHNGPEFCWTYQLFAYMNTRDALRSNCRSQEPDIDLERHRSKSAKYGTGCITRALDGSRHATKRVIAMD